MLFLTAAQHSQMCSARQFAAACCELAITYTRFPFQAQHLDMVGCEEIAIVRLQIEISERLMRLYTLAKRIAKEALPAEVALKGD